MRVKYINSSPFDQNKNNPYQHLERVEVKVVNHTLGFSLFLVRSQYIHQAKTGTGRHHRHYIRCKPYLKQCNERSDLINFRKVKEGVGHCFEEFAVCNKKRLRKECKDEQGHNRDHQQEEVHQGKNKTERERRRRHQGENKK